MKPLNPREKQFASVLAKGYDMKFAAYFLGIEIRTAYRVRESVLRKLGFRNQADVIAVALQSRLNQASEPRVT